MPERVFRFILRIPRTLPEVAFVLNRYRQLLELRRFPVTEVCLQDHMGSLECPTELELVGKPDMQVEHSFLKDALGPKGRERRQRMKRQPLRFGKPFWEQCLF
jgi:hypothetical protein